MSFQVLNRVPAGQHCSRGALSIEVVADDTRYVACSSQKVFRVDAKGHRLSSCGGPGEAPGTVQTSRRGALALGPSGDVYVVDAGNYRIQVFSPSGRFIRSIGTFSNGLGQFGTRSRSPSIARATST